MPAEWGLGALVVLTAIAAGFWGGRRERLTVAVFAVLAGDWLLLRHAPRPHVAAGMMLGTDLLALAWLGRIAWKAPRDWPVWAMAPQAVAVAASLAFLLQPDVGADLYLRALMMVRYATVLTLLIGLRQRATAHP